MKKILCLFVLILSTFALTQAQSVTPRFGITPNNDNTGRVLTYKYFPIADVAGADSAAIVPRAWQTNYQLAMTDSFTFKQPNISLCYVGDNVRIIASGASGNKIKFTGSYWKATGPAILSTVGKAVIEFVFDGSVWVEAGRSIQ